MKTIKKTITKDATKERIQEQAGITTLKLSTTTKERLEHLRIYRRETYDDLLQRLLDVLNLCRANPEQARVRLLLIEKQRKLALPLSKDAEQLRALR